MCNPKSYHLHWGCLCRLLDVEVTVGVGVTVQAGVVVGVGVRDHDCDRLGGELIELVPRLGLRVVATPAAGHLRRRRICHHRHAITAVSPPDPPC